MQRLVLSVRRCSNVMCRSTCGRWSSFSSGQKHDDFWSDTTTRAQETPAYRAAAAAPASATSGATSPPDADGDEGTTRGSCAAGRMPMGDAYGPSSGSGFQNGSMPPSTRSPSAAAVNSQHFDFNQQERPQPVFDLQSSMHLSPVKLVDVRMFKGKTLVDIRQYFKASQGTVLPSKKGISLTVAQWRRLQASMAEVEKQIQALESNSALDHHQNYNGQHGPLDQE